MLRETGKGILSGLMVSIGGAVYLACENRYVGAVLFSVALITICLMQFSLYTGKIGFLVENHKKSDVIATFSGLLGNFIGCVIFGLLLKVALHKLSEASVIICNSKLDQTSISALIRAFFCGVLMFVAVWSYKEKKTLAGIFVCIPVFILSGFEHSIADMFYLSIAGFFNFKALLYVLIIVLGNSLGGMFIPAMQKLINFKKGKNSNE